MHAKPGDVVASFGARAAAYARSDWHRLSAERLVELCDLPRGCRVLDAATGTGFVAVEAARAVGAGGLVVGVDVSAGMLREARRAVDAAGLTNVELIEGDAVHLAQFGPATFDAITCGTGLLYMSPAEALREWFRLLKVGGLLAFSTVGAGSPAGARLFRECAARLGMQLRDPCAPLGTTAACRSVLVQSGFDVTQVVSEAVSLSPGDVANGWESNFKSASHPELRGLGATDRDRLRRDYLEALARQESTAPGTLAQVTVLYALARRGLTPV